jgi:hypothetical protein
VLPRSEWHAVRGRGGVLPDGLLPELPVVPSSEAEGLGIHDGIFVIFQKTG